MGPHGDPSVLFFPRRECKKTRHMFKAVFGCQREAKNYIVYQMRFKNTYKSDQTDRHRARSGCVRN